MYFVYVYMSESEKEYISPVKKAGLVVGKTPEVYPVHMQDS